MTEIREELKSTFWVSRIKCRQLVCCPELATSGKIYKTVLLTKAGKFSRANIINGHEVGYHHSSKARSWHAGKSEKDNALAAPAAEYHLSA